MGKSVMGVIRFTGDQCAVTGLNQRIQSNLGKPSESLWTSFWMGVVVPAHNT